MRLCVETILHRYPVNRMTRPVNLVRSLSKGERAECAQTEEFHSDHMAHRGCVFVVRLFLADKERRRNASEHSYRGDRRCNVARCRTAIRTGIGEVYRRAGPSA